MASPRSTASRARASTLRVALIWNKQDLTSVVVEYGVAPTDGTSFHPPVEAPPAAALNPGPVVSAP